MNTLFEIIPFVDKVPPVILLGIIWILFRRIYVLEKDFLEEYKSWTSTCVPALVASIVPVTLFYPNFFRLIPPEFRLLWAIFYINTMLIIVWMTVIYTLDSKKHRDVKNAKRPPLQSF